MHGQFFVISLLCKLIENTVNYVMKLIWKITTFGLQNEKKYYILLISKKLKTKADVKILTIFLRKFFDLPFNGFRHFLEIFGSFLTCNKNNSAHIFSINGNHNN
jgi:hypothetical protein